MHTVIDLDGLNMARGKVTKAETLLVLSCPSVCRENGYIPAESFTLDDIDAIRGLHKLLGEMLAAHEAMRPQAMSMQVPTPSLGVKL